MRTVAAALAFGCALLDPVGSKAAEPLPDFERCEAAVRDRPERKESYRCFFEVARARQAWDEAVRRLDVHVARDRSNPLPKLTLAYLEIDRGSDRAEPLFREAAEGFASADDAEGEVFARMGLAAFLRHRGRGAEADPVLEVALRAARASPDPILVARVRVDQTVQALERSDFSVALGLTDEAEAIAVAEGSTELHARVLADRGYAYWEMGMYRRSLEVYARQAELLRGLGDRWGASYEESGARYSIAVLAGHLFREGEMERADVIRLAGEALDAAMRAGHRVAEARARLLASYWIEPQAAVEEARRALALARTSGDRQTEGAALLALGARLLLADPARSEEAFRRVDEAIENARSRGAHEDLARGLCARAAMLHRSGARVAWLDASREALDAIERIRDLQPETMIRARVFGPWAFAYYRLSGELLAGEGSSPDPRGDLDLAFSTIERMRSRVLLEQLDQAGAAPSAERPPRSPVADLGVVRSRLEPDQALVSFQLPHASAREDDPFEEGGAWVMLVTRDRVRAFPLPDRGAVEDAVAVFLGLCRQRDGSERRAATRLFRDLLAAPLGEAGDEIGRLIVVPDGVLNRLPFAALRADPEAPPLAARFEIAIVPSATLWLRWRNAADAPIPRATLALADPDLPVPSPRAESESASWVERMRFGPLPHARREARILARTFGSESRVLTGAEASEAALKRAPLAEFGVLHLAAHAIVDAAVPQNTAVVLAPGDAREDGLLQLREIVELPLDGRLVIVATCRSASGVEIDGEGVLGLARGFFQAGARAVVGTLWPVRDEDAEAFAIRFSRGLGRGRSVGAAHAGALRDASLAGLPAAAWAGVVVIGDGDWVPLPAEHRPAARLAPWPLLVSGIGVLLACGLLLARARFRRPSHCLKPISRSNSSAPATSESTQSR